MTDRELMQQALEALDKYGFAPCDKEEDWQGFKRAITAIREALAEQPVQEPVRNADELPKGFIPLQQENGKIVYAACLDPNASHYKWLMWKHPDGQWVSKRKLEDWEVMQVEDQEYYSIVQEAAHGIKGDA